MTPPTIDGFKRHGGARWDAYLYVTNPDALAAEFTSRGVTFSEPIKDTDGYVLFFGRPQADKN